jgi:hypothetical protein
MHAFTLLLVSLQASRISCTSPTFYTRLLGFIYKLQSQSYLHTSVCHYSSFAHYRYKLYISHMSVTTCICTTISYILSTSLLRVCNLYKAVTGHTCKRKFAYLPYILHKTCIQAIISCIPSHSCFLQYKLHTLPVEALHFPHVCYYLHMNYNVLQSRTYQLQGFVSHKRQYPAIHANCSFVDVVWLVLLAARP